MKSDTDFYFEHLVDYALTGKIPTRRNKKKKKTVKLLDTGHKNETIAEKLDKKSHTGAY